MAFTDRFFLPGTLAFVLALLSTGPVLASPPIRPAELREVIHTATDPGEVRTALTALISMADAGELRAQVEIARILQQGMAVAPDPAQAVHFWGLAAEQGHDGARYQLARALIRGEGVEADPVRAVQLLRIGADGGHVASISNLARALETGVGVPPDPAEAARLYERAAAEGQAYARFRLAIALSAGAGVQADPARALAFLDALVAEGYPAAPFALAEVLMTHRPRATGRIRAQALWEAEALAGNDRALARLARNFPNDYVRLVQSALREQGVYRGRVNGRLTNATIQAIAVFCRTHGIGDICRHGPMRSDTARAIGKVLFPQPD